MKKLFLSILFLAMLLAGFGQSESVTKDTSINGYNLRVTTISNLNWSPDSSNCIIYFVDGAQVSGQTPPGGFGGNQYDYDTSLLALTGPHKYMRAHSWDGGIALSDGVKRYPVIITFQTPNYPRPGNINATVTSIISRYRIKKKGLFLCGPSMGGWSSGQYSSYQPTAGDYSYIQRVRAVFMFDPVDLSDTYGATPAFASRYQYFATQGALSTGGKLLAFQQTSGLNGRSHEAVDTMNAYVSGSAQWVNSTVGDGSHGCCFDSIFGGTPVPKKFVVFSLYQDAYQWMLRQGDSSLNIPGTNSAPSATATASNSGYVLQPASSSTLTGSGTDIDGTIASYSWSQVSGPGTATITTPTATSTTVTSLVLGTYVFRLTVTDNLGATGSKDVSVAVICSTCVVAIAGADQSIPYTQGYAFIDGSLSIGTPLTYTWRLINPNVNEPSIGKIVHYNSSVTPVRILPYNSNGWQYELTVANGTNSAKDTVVLNITWPSMPPLSAGYHRATSVDTTAIGLMGNPGLCKIGDFIVDGANDGAVIAGQKTDIYINGFAGNTFTSGQKILIKAARYGKIAMNFNQGQVTATNANPVVITNYGGQVECTNFTVNGGVNIELTGKYVAGLSGHPSWLGFDGGYAFRDGTFGIWVNNRWTSEGGGDLNIGGLSDSVSVHDLQTGNGGFAAVFIKQNDIAEANISNIYRHFKFYKVLSIHPHGEAWYWGSTGVDSASGGTLYQHLLQDFDVHDNINAFAGNEILQIGQMGGGMHIYKNVFYLSAMNWGSPFDNQQNFAEQIDIRNGGNRIDSNIFIRSGEQIPSVFAIRKHGIVSNGDSTIMEKNLYTHGLGNIGGYVGGSTPTAGTLLVFKNNTMGNFNFLANRYFSDARGTNTQEVLRTQIGTGAHISVRNNISDNTKTGFFTGFSGTFDTSGNSKQASVRYPKFANTGFTSIDSTLPYIMERWVDTIYKTNGDEYPNQNVSGGVFQGSLRTYASGDYVIDLGKIYKSRVGSNQGHMPYPGDSTYWQIQSWINSGVTVYVPPLDLRLPTTDPYQIQGMGLTATSNGNTAPTANAGADQTITLPVNAVTLSGTGSDIDGTIASYGWTKISGPGTYTITSPAAQTTTVTGLVAGTYVFQLTVTDNGGATGFSNVTITVNAAIVTPSRYTKQFTILKH
jgi:hypothetical protein